MQYLHKRDANFWNRANIILLAILVEHCVIALKIVISLLIPDVPFKVREAEFRRNKIEDAVQKELIELKISGNHETFQDMNDRLTKEAAEESRLFAEMEVAEEDMLAADGVMTEEKAEKAKKRREEASKKKAEMMKKMAEARQKAMIDQRKKNKKHELDKRKRKKEEKKRKKAEKEAQKKAEKGEDSGFREHHNETSDLLKGTQPVTAADPPESSGRKEKKDKKKKSDKKSKRSDHGSDEDSDLQEIDHLQ